MLPDDIDSWGIERFEYSGRQLVVVLVPMVLDTVDADILIGDINLGPGRKILPKSDRFVVTFEDVVAMQSIDESCCNADSVRENNGKPYFKIIKKTAYLDFLDKVHLVELAGEDAKLYRLITLDEVLDVLVTTDPRIEHKEA